MVAHDWQYGQSIFHLLPENESYLLPSTGPTGTRADRTIERTLTNLRNRATGYFLASFFMLVAAFVGGGIGAVMFFILVSAFGLTILEANATYSLPVLVLTTVSLCIFIPKGLVDYSAGLVLFLGMLTGGYLGTHTALKKGDAWVRKAVVTMSIVLSVKLIIDSFR